MKKIYFATLITLISLILTSSIFALSLSQAKAKGWVTEQSNGYLRANNPAAQALVQNVNSKRQAAYAEIARKNNLRTNQVAARAGSKIRGR